MARLKAEYFNAKDKATGEIKEIQFIPPAPSDGDLGGISQEKLEQIDELKGDLDILNQGGLNLKEDFIGRQVDNWLNVHPEATTTVQDGAITEAKIHQDYALKITNNYVTPEMFGAKGDGKTDDTKAFEKALKATAYVKCNPRAIYYFKSIVDVSTLSTFILDLCGCTFINFHIKINIGDDGYKARSAWPIYPATIKNGTLGEYNKPSDDWEIPAIQTGTLLRLENLTCMSTPYLVAFTNNYRDNCSFKNVINITGYTFGENELKLDAISGIVGPNKFDKLSAFEKNDIAYNGASFAGDGWIIEQCNEWHYEKNPNYSFLHTCRQTNLTAISCIQTRFVIGLHSNATLISCHFERKEVQTQRTGYSSAIVFNSCYFYVNNTAIIDDHRITYIGCHFRGAHDSPDKTTPLSRFTNGKYFWQLNCRFINCALGNYCVIDSEKLLRRRYLPRKTYHYYTKLSEYTRITGITSENQFYGRFLPGDYKYTIFVFATGLSTVAFQKFEGTITIDNAETMVHLNPNSLWSHGGGMHIDVYRTYNDIIEKFSAWIDPNDEYYNSAINCPLRFEDYGTFAVYGYSDTPTTTDVEPWISTDSIPTDIEVNDRVLEANGILVTTDNSVITSRHNGYVQVQQIN